MELRLAAIMPHGFGENVTQITGLSRPDGHLRAPGERRALGYNRATFSSTRDDA
jgi:hypothetical protein